MSDTLIVFKSDIGFRTSELVNTKKIGPGIEVGSVSFSLEKLSSNQPLEVSMTLVDFHELPIFMERVKSQLKISAELDFYDRIRLDEKQSGSAGTMLKVGDTSTFKDNAIFLSIMSSDWRVRSASFSAHEHGRGGTVELVLTVSKGAIYSFIVDAKGKTSNHNNISWEIKN
jgi:hypothetical protein